MNTRNEVDTGEGSALTAAVRDQDTAHTEAATKDPKSRPKPQMGDENAGRVSIDPLRATDRYRLVTPLPLQL